MKTFAMHYCDICSESQILMKTALYAKMLLGYQHKFRDQEMHWGKFIQNE